MKKNVILKEMIISNFKGQNQSLTFGANVNKITGKNRAGKSTIMKAFNWMLTGCADAYTPMNSDLFDNRYELTKDTPLASVKAKLCIDGIDYTIERTAQAKFTRKRGTSEYEKASSDEYKYFIDDVEYLATDFDKWICANLCDTKLLKYAVNGQFFLNLVMDDKKKARIILSQIIGDVTDDEIEGDFPHVRASIDKLDIDQIATQATTRKSKIQESIDTLQITIKSKENEVSRLSDTDFDYIERCIDDKNKKIENLDEVIIGESTIPQELQDAIAKAKSSKATIQDMIANAKKSYDEQYDNNVAKLERSIKNIVESNNDIDNRNNKRFNEIESAKQQKEYKERELDALNHKRNSMIAERDAVVARVFTNDHCPYCGQILPVDKLEEAKAQFNKKKELELQNIVSRGKANTANITQIESDIEKLNVIINAGFEKEEKQDVDGLKGMLQALKDEYVPYESTEQYKEYKSQLDVIVVPQIPENNVQQYKSEKKDLQNELQELNRQFGLKSRLIELHNEIESLQQEIKEHACMLAEQEQIVQEVADYKQAKMEKLSEKVNRLLNYSKIEIWSIQKNGDVKPDLIIKDEMGVNYATTNGASRLTVAVDIQHFFSESLGVQLPYFVDESSIMNDENLPRFEDAQMFYMYCTDDAQLKVASC